MRPRALRSNKGFTLIELMIVVVIIGILAALAIPRFGQAAARAKEKEADGILKQYYTLQQAYSAQAGRWAADVTELNNIGWEAPSGLKHYTMFTVDATWPKVMAKQAGQTGFCNRQIDNQGFITSVAGTC